MDVHDYLEAASRLPWRWGEQDCTKFCSAWAVIRCGRDPSEGVRAYNSEAGAREIIDEAGGMVRFIGDRLEAIGWQPVVSARDGDIAVVEALMAPFGHKGEIPAIMAGGLWTYRTQHQQRAGMFRVLAAWSV